MSSIIFHIENQTGWITLNRPEKLNAFNREMALAMQEALNRCADNSIRCVVITGAGKGFSAGQDLAEVTDPSGPGMARILSEHFNPIVLAIRDLKKPVLAAVNGVAAGAGANIALGCDIVVAAKSASFIQAFSRIGLIPDSGGTFYLPRLVGQQKAAGIMMLGEKISATDADRMGMIYKSIDDEQFPDTVRKIADELAELPTLALAYTKKALQWSFTHTLQEQLINEDKLQQRAAVTEDFREGVDAFLKKRPAKFKGR
ncbi:enoyl-CoA hydratase-related protein [Flavihumibacter petaseus]|nr:enoyl-CoA hydratase-related protein [Flavihumibacter petaseus]